jgi:hypothetical protein
MRQLIFAVFFRIISLSKEITLLHFCLFRETATVVTLFGRPTLSDNEN